MKVSELNPLGCSTAASKVPRVPLRPGPLRHHMQYTGEHAMSWPCIFTVLDLIKIDFGRVEGPKPIVYSKRKDPDMLHSPRAYLSRDVQVSPL